MKKNFSWHTRLSILTVVVFSLVFTACHFDSDKDYKKDEDKVAADSTHQEEHGQEQHKASNPPVDAAKPVDSTQNNSPSTGKDSSIKHD